MQSEKKRFYAGYAGLFLRAAVIVLLGVSILQTEGAIAQEMPLTVVAADQGAPEEMSKGDLKKVMMGKKKRWADGSKIIIALLKTKTPVGKAVCKRVYGMTPNKVNKYWIAQVFQGKAKAPRSFDSEKALLEYVAETDGAIGIVSAAAAEKFERKIKVDGKVVW